MPLFKIRWTPFSLRCLEDIHFYITSEAKSEIPADKFILKIYERVEALQTHPYIGQSEALLEAIGQESRHLVEGNYKIIYQVGAEEVIITDIFHTKQNPNKIVKRNRKP